VATGWRWGCWRRSGAAACRDPPRAGQGSSPVSFSPGGSGPHSRRPPGSGTAQVGTPSLGSSQRCTTR